MLLQPNKIICKLFVEDKAVPWLPYKDFTKKISWNQFHHRKLLKRFKKKKKKTVSSSELLVWFLE